MLHGIFLDRKGYLYEIFLFSGSNSLPFNSFPPYWNLEFAYANCFQSDRSIHAPVFWLINSSWTLASNLIQQHSSICTSLSFFNHCSDKVIPGSQLNKFCLYWFQISLFFLCVGHFLSCRCS